MRGHLRSGGSWRNTRSGQLQALEPIIITIILAVILGIGLLFYVKISDHEAAGDRSVLQREEDEATIKRIVAMPELSCPRIEGLPPNCIDMEKARQFGGLLKEGNTRQYYSPVLGLTNITIESVDLGTGERETITLYTNTKAEKVTATTTYFTVFEPVSGTTRFGTLMIQRERR